ncbi:MAG TPA: hypothetical protein VFR09_01080 [Alphaproteobacteria bacterium]|nr:hypothetical protein [Alphaproteobacteria bacterium]
MENKLKFTALGITAAALAACHSKPHSNTNEGPPPPPPPAPLSAAPAAAPLTPQAVTPQAPPLDPAHVKSESHVQQVLSRYSPYITRQDIAFTANGLMRTDAATQEALCDSGRGGGMTLPCKILLAHRVRNGDVPVGQPATPASAWERAERACFGADMRGIRWNFDAANNIAHATLRGPHPAYVDYNFTSRNVTSGAQVAPADQQVIRGTNVYVNGSLAGGIPRAPVVFACPAPNSAPTPPAG